MSRKNETRNEGHEKTSRKRFESNFLAGYHDRQNNTIEEWRTRKNGTKRKRHLFRRIV